MAFHRSTVTSVLACATLAAAAGTSHAAIEVIYTKKAAHPTAGIPGPVDLTGAPAVSEWKGLESLVMAPGGTQWLIKGRTNLGTDLEHIVVIGSGTTGSRLVQEGMHAPGGGADERFEFFGSTSGNVNPLGRFDESGRFAFSGQARAAATGTTSAPNGHRVFMWDGATFSMVLQQSNPYTGVFDSAAAPGGGAPGNEAMGNAVGSVHLLNNGTIGHIDGGISGVGFTLRPASFYNLALFHQSGGVDTVTDLSGLGTATFATSTGVAQDRFNTTPDGAHWMMVGTIAGSPTRSVLVRDGQVVIQNGTPAVPGIPNAGTVTNFELLPDGHWFAWGGYAAQAGFWAVKDGVLVAKAGDPITTGSAEVWGNSVYMVTGNLRGDWVIAASTNAANAGANEVLTLNGNGVLAREGDMIDLNNNGIADDDGFIGRGSVSLSAFINGCVGVSDDGYAYFFANIHDSLGADIQSPSFFGNPNGFFRVQFTPTPLPCGSADFDADGDTGTDADIEAFLACVGGNCCPACGSADFDSDGDTGTDADIEAFFRVLGGGEC